MSPTLQEVSDRLSAVEESLARLTTAMLRHNGQIGSIMQDRTDARTRLEETEGRILDHESKDFVEAHPID
jgi:hypothetical protein